MIRCEHCRSNRCSSLCPYAQTPKQIGACTQCGEPILANYEYYTDFYDNTFCSEDCAKEYHGIGTKIQEETTYDKDY